MVSSRIESEGGAQPRLGALGMSELLGVKVPYGVRWRQP